MSIRESQAQLTRALQDLLIHWDRTRGTWRDSRAREFESRILEPLAAKLKHATSAMDRMAGNLQRARRECSDSSDT